MSDEEIGLSVLDAQVVGIGIGSEDNECSDNSEQDEQDAGTDLVDLAFIFLTDLKSFTSLFLLSGLLAGFFLGLTLSFLGLLLLLFGLGLVEFLLSCLGCFSFLGTLLLGFGDRYPLLLFLFGLQAAGFLLFLGKLLHNVAEQSLEQRLLFLLPGCFVFLRCIESLDLVLKCS